MAKQDREIVDPKIRTIEDFETYYGLASSFTAPWHENIKKWRRLYDFDHYEKKALPFEERYPDPTPTNVVDLAVGILLAKPLEFKARGWQEDMQSESDATRVEKFLTGAIYVNSERHEVNIPYESVLNIVRDGASVVYCVWDPVVAKSSLIMSPDGQKQVLARLPLNLQVIDPLQIFLLPGGPKRFGHIFHLLDDHLAQVLLEAADGFPRQCLGLLRLAGVHPHAGVVRQRVDVLGVVFKSLQECRRGFLNVPFALQHSAEVRPHAGELGAL